MIDLYRFTLLLGRCIRLKDRIYFFSSKKTKLRRSDLSNPRERERKGEKSKKIEKNVIEGDGGEKFHARIAFDKRLRISRARFP